MPVHSTPSVSSGTDGQTFQLQAFPGVGLKKRSTGRSHAESSHGFSSENGDHGVATSLNWFIEQRETESTSEQLRCNSHFLLQSARKGLQDHGSRLDKLHGKPHCRTCNSIHYFLKDLGDDGDAASTDFDFKERLAGKLDDAVAQMSWDLRGVGEFADGRELSYPDPWEAPAYAPHITIDVPDFQSSQQHCDPPAAGIPLSSFHAQYSVAQRSWVRKFEQASKKLRPCHIFILLTVITILGSLIPALWCSIARNDMSGGFTLAQYILGAGVLVIGCMVAIHSRTCTCWHKPQ